MKYIPKLNIVKEYILTHQDRRGYYIGGELNHKKVTRKGLTKKTIFLKKRILYWIGTLVIKLNDNEENINFEAANKKQKQ